MLTIRRYQPEDQEAVWSLHHLGLRQAGAHAGEGPWDDDLAKIESAYLSGGGEFLAFLRYLRTLYPPGVRIGIVLDNYSPHLSTRDDPRIGQWAQASNVELASTPTKASWLNRIEAQFTALRYFTLDGTDHPTHHEQASIIRRYIAWRNRNAHDRRLGEIINRANVA